MKKFKIIAFLIVVFITQSTVAQENKNFYYSKTVEGIFSEVVAKTKEAFKEQGFGVVSELDMDMKLKEKLENVDIKPYKIIGMCNPTFAYKSLQIEENIGVFLPCNVIVKDIGKGKIEVAVVNPSALMGMLNKPELVVIANEVSTKFQKALEKL